MLFHKRQDLANCRIWQIAGFGKSRAQTKQQTFFVGTLGCPLTKPSSTRIELFNRGLWGLLVASLVNWSLRLSFSRFACQLVASLVLQSLRLSFSRFACQLVASLVLQSLRLSTGRFACPSVASLVLL